MMDVQKVAVSCHLSSLYSQLSSFDQFMFSINQHLCTINPMLSWTRVPVA